MAHAGWDGELCGGDGLAWHGAGQASLGGLDVVDVIGR